MAISTAMTWQADKRRWRKLYKGKLHFISCIRLRSDPTKVGSYQAADAWWAKKKAEVDATSPALPMQSTIDELDHRRVWAQDHGESELLRRIDAAIIEAKEATDADELVRDAMLGASEVARRVWEDRLRGRTKAPADKDVTIAHHVERFVALERVRADSCQLSISEFDTTRRCLHDFRDWIGGSMLITSLDADRWESWWLRLIQVDCSIE